MQLGAIEGDPIRFADWAELQILYSGAASISLESIRSEVDVEGLLEHNDSFEGPIPLDEVSEHLVAEAIREIERRTADGGRGYPFRLHADSLELRPDVDRWTPYAFCLMVSDRDYWTPGDPSSRMFEHIASRALESYLQGSAMRFGAPREASERNIEVALRHLEERTGDRLISMYPVKSTDKDLGLDVVGWRNFDDCRTSKLLVYMQCATGEDWLSKKGDLDLSVWNQIMVWTVAPVKALAIPYVVSPGLDWARATPGLLLLDRLRISSMLPATTVCIDGLDWHEWFKRRVDWASKRAGLGA